MFEHSYLLVVDGGARNQGSVDSAGSESENHPDDHPNTAVHSKYPVPFSNTSLNTVNFRFFTQ